MACRRRPPPARAGPAPRAGPGSRACSAPAPAVVPAPTSEKVTFAADASSTSTRRCSKPEGRAKLDDLVSKMSGLNLEVIIAVGHTDSVGADAYNQKLSIRRSEAVKSYLVSKGVEKNRVYTEGKGEKQPVADNKTAEGRAKNRRVEIEVVGTRAEVSASTSLARFADSKTALRGFFVWVGSDRVSRRSMPTRASSPSSASSPIAGGTPRAISGRCTDQSRCASTGSTGSPAAGQARARRRLRRRHPRRLDGATRRRRARHRSRRQAAQGGAAPCDRGGDARASSTARSRSRRSPTRCPNASTSSPAWRCSSTSLTRRSIVAACGRLATPGGWAFFSTINRNAKAFAFAIVGAEHVLKLLPRGTHEYAKFLRPSELAAWCRAASLEPVSTRGLEYNPLSRRYRLSADTSVNYLVACRKPA